MTAKKRFLRAVNFLFIVLITVQFLPNSELKEDNGIYVIWFSLIVEAAVILISLISKKEIALNLFSDIISFLYVLLILWTIASAKSDFLDKALFPPPGDVFKQFIEDISKILLNIGSSLGIIAQGYLLALVIAIPLGLFLGYSVRLGNAATYISKFLGSIPPIVYIPYGIALLPTFRSVSVFVIFLASFWPVLSGTMSGVLNVDKRVIDSARVLNVGKFSMLFSVILPASLSEIFVGCNQGLSVSFILLTSAEMIGANSGMGYYVKNYSDFGDYTRTIVGLLVIGIVVVVISFLFNKLQRFLLRYKR